MKKKEIKKSKKTKVKKKVVKKNKEISKPCIKQGGSLGYCTGTSKERWYMNYLYYPFHWYIVNPINNSYWAVRYFIQRIFIGFDDREVFNLDYCLKEWLAPRLEKLIKTRSCGVPGFSKLTEKKWVNILNEILWLAKDSFKEEQNLMFGKVKNKDKKWEEFNKREEKARKLLGKYLNNLWD